MGEYGAVINVECDDSDAPVGLEHVDAGVGVEGLEAIHLKMSINGAIPLVGCLLEPVERLVELADVVGSLRINVAFRLCHIDHLSEWCVKECHLNVHLVDLKVVGHHEGKKELEVLNAYNGREGLVVIDVPHLGEALGDEVGLVPFDGAVHLDLQFEDEHRFHNAHSWSSRYEFPGVVVMEVLNLLIHGSLPVLCIGT